MAGHGSIAPIGDRVSQLKLALLQAYSSFSDKRIKRLERGHLFIVDDRVDGDIGADGKLLSYFCEIYADVISDDELIVRLHGVPVSPPIEEWADKCGAVLEGGRMTLTLQRGQQALLSGLATRVRAIVASGAPRYQVKSYKYVCPRVAKSLDRLETVLDGPWRPGSKGVVQNTLW